MSGRKQHFIPRFVLRGFLKKGSAGEEVVVFKKGAKPSTKGLKGIAAERDFYSEPSTDGAPTLDDHITKYENRLGAMLFELRQCNIGSQVDALVAAEIIGHLAPRSNHIRKVFAHGVSQVTSKAFSSLTDADGLSRLLGLDTPEPNPKFVKMLKEGIMASPVGQNIKSMNLPERQLERMLVVGIRDGWDALANMVLPQFLEGLKAFAEAVGGIVKDGHNKFLAEQIGGGDGRADLKDYSWSIVAAPAEGAALPDCVALGVKEDGSFSPLLMVPRADLRVAIMPLTSAKLLVGRRTEDAAFEIASLNHGCAECSREFFVSSE